MLISEERSEFVGRFAAQIEQSVDPADLAKFTACIAELERSVPTDITTPEVVDHLLEPFFNGGPIEQLRQSRIELEALVAKTVSRRSTTGELESRVIPVHLAMKELQGVEQGNENWNEFWKLDIDFHYALCQVAGLEQMEHVLSAVRKRATELGLPRSLEDLKETCEEHDRILAAIKSGNDGDIYDAVTGHVSAAFRRWFCRGEIAAAVKRAAERLGTVDSVLESSLEFFITEAFKHSHDGYPLIECDRLSNDLISQYEYPNEYVVYREENRTIDGVERIERKVLKHSRDWEEIAPFIEQLDANSYSVDFSPPVEVSIS